MPFLSLSDGDWRIFLRWSRDEGWQIPFQEQRLFQNQWQPFIFVLKLEGQVLGFVSAVAYKESGWIGNLLVDPGRRGRGYGAALLDFALDFLRQLNLRRIWLTASEAGHPLYQRRGFVAIDRVDRWVVTGGGQQELESDTSTTELIDLDRRCWGESRAPLLSLLADAGHLCCCGETLGLLQPGVDFWQLGPWLSADKFPRDSRRLLTQAIEKTVAGKELLVDVLASSEMELVLRNSRFHKRGSNLLMVLSDKPVKLDGVIALASLGSIG